MTIEPNWRRRSCTLARRWRIPAALLASAGCSLVLAGGTSSAGRAHAQPTVWFAPLPADPGMQPKGSTDYMGLFSRNARWSRAARRVRVFKLYDTWITNFATPGELARIVAGLKRRRIALAVEVLPLVATAACGSGIEGFAESGHVGRLARALKAAGGSPSYVAFDEPFAFGHLYDGPNACRWPSEQVARALSAYVRRLRRWFPKVVAGDIEPLWAGVDPGELEGWVATYARVTGRPMSFFDLDMDFSRSDWVQTTSRLETFAHVHGVTFGFIYIGAGGSDREWSRKAEERIADYEARTGLRPDRAILQSWLSRPDRVLPETRPGTFTWLVNRYFRPRPHMRVRVSGDVARATLAGTRGSPLGAKRVQLTATPINGSGQYDEYTAAGTVPAGAVRAVVGLRVNLECGCSGPADLTLYRASYAEPGGPNRVPNPRFDDGLLGWGTWGEASVALEPSDRGGSALHVETATSQAAGVNSSEFQTSPGRRFALSFAARVAPRSAGSGYFGLMFLDRNDVEVSRTQVPLAAASLAIGSGVTDRKGAVEGSVAGLRGGSFLVEAWFRGTEGWFPAYASATLLRP